MTCKNALSSSTQVAKYGWLAKRRAKSDWRRKAKAAYGKKYCKWWKARDRECPAWGPRGEAQAIATARPCR